MLCCVVLVFDVFCSDFVVCGCWCSYYVYAGKEITVRRISSIGKI
jgi:hypothetical protein